MNISEESNALNSVKSEKEYIKARNKVIKKYNQGVRFRNFLRKHR